MAEPTHYEKAHKLFQKMNAHTIGYTTTEVFDAVAFMVASTEAARSMPPDDFNRCLLTMRSKIPEAVAASKATHKRN